MHDVADGNAHGPAGPALLLDDFRAAALGPLEDRVLKSRRAFRQTRQRQAVDRALDQTGTMESPCSPRINAFTCVGASRSSSAIKELKRDVSSMVPRP